MVDDLNSWVGTLGTNPATKTPFMDGLMQASTSFSNAHSASIRCAPARHAMLSGKRPSTTGWYASLKLTASEYAADLDGTVPLPTHFKQHGYKTMAAGKVFHKGTSDISGYDYWDEVRSPFQWPAHLVARGHGYQGSDGGHFYPFPADGGAIYQLFQSGVKGQSLCEGPLEAADIPDEGMPDEQIALWAVNQLKKEHSQPWFLAVG